MKNKIVSAAVIRTDDIVSISGFVGIGTPDELLLGLERRFLDAGGEPAGPILVFAAAPSDSGERGLNRLAHPGLVKRAVGGHWAPVPKLARHAADGDQGLQPTPPPHHSAQLVGRRRTS